MSWQLRFNGILLVLAILGSAAVHAQSPDRAPALGAFVGTTSSDGDMLVGGGTTVPLRHHVLAAASLSGELSSSELLIATLMLRHNLGSSGIQPYVGLGMDWTHHAGRSDLGGAVALGVEWPLPWVATDQARSVFSFFGEGHLHTTGYAAVRAVAGVRGELW